MSISVRDINGRLDAIDEHGNVVLTAEREHGGWTVGVGSILSTTVGKKPEARAMLIRRAELLQTPDGQDGALALAAICPRCPALPGELCQGDGVGDNGIGGGNPYSVHVGRLKVALPAPRDARHAWLDFHDQHVTHRAEVAA